MTNWAQVFKNKNLAVISLQGPLCKLHSREKPALSSLPALFLSCESGLIKELLGTYINHYNWGFPYPVKAVQLWLTILTNQDGTFGPIKLQKFRVLICMTADLSGARIRDFCPYKPLWLWVHTSLPTEDCVSLAELKHWRCVDRTEQSRLP